MTKSRHQIRLTACVQHGPAKMKRKPYTQRMEKRKSRGIKINVSSKTIKDIRITCSMCFKQNKQESPIAFKIKDEMDTYSHFLQQNNLPASFPIKNIKRSMVLMKVENNDISYIWTQKDVFKKTTQRCSQKLGKRRILFCCRQEKKDPVWKNKQTTHKATSSHIY